jgi:hypothetical protein
MTSDTCCTSIPLAHTSVVISTRLEGRGEDKTGRGEEEKGRGERERDKTGGREEEERGRGEDERRGEGRGEECKVLTTSWNNK